MKKITNLFIAILFVANLWAQAPQKMSYQAVVRNAENNLVANQSIGMQISILQGSEDGTVVYAETQNPTSNANGLVSLQIGEGTVVEGDLSTINWQNGPFFIKTETDPMGGTDYSITGVSELLSVPFALHAATAKTVENVEMDGAATAFEGWDKNAADDFDGDYNSLSNKPDLSTIDTKLSETEVDEMVANNGYLTNFTEVDGDVTNEIQDLKLEGNTLTITNNGTATAIDLSKYLDNSNTQLTETEVDEMVANNGYLSSFTEVDGDVTNEIQDLKLEGNILKITNNRTATEIDLSKYLDNTNTQLSETEVDEMVANNGYLTSFTEADGDVTNEIQDLTFDAVTNILKITNNGTATEIDLSKYLDNTNTQLTESEVDAFVGNNGYAADADLHAVAKSGNYADLQNTPVLWDSTYATIKGVPTNVSTFTNDAGYLTSFTEADGDATNEIQDLTFDVATNILKITNNGTATEIDLSKYLDNTNTQLNETEVDAFVANNGYAADADLHTIAKSGNYTDLENTPVLWDSTYATIKGVPTNVSTFANDAGYQLAADDEDTDATNEIQDLNFNATSNVLSLSSPVSSPTIINLSKYLDDTKLSDSEVISIIDNAGFQLDIDDADVSITNEIQDLSFDAASNTLKITNNSSASEINLSAYLDDTKLNEADVDAFVNNNGYAVDADLHAVAKSGNYSDLESAPDLTVYATKDMGNEKISNLADPTEAQDAATKAYVDELEKLVESLIGWHNNSGSTALLTTGEMSEITNSTATASADIFSAGGTAITDRGFVWSTTQNPTIASNEGSVSSGSGDGSFTGSLTGLSSITTYYVRAYATNTDGTSYGNEISFETAPALGDYYQGGVVFHIFTSGQNGYVEGETHGLVCATTNLGIYTWGCNDVASASFNIGEGESATNSIEEACGEDNTAAHMCYTALINGYDDWFLPSYKELLSMQTQKDLIDATAIANGGTAFGSNFYWTSQGAASGIARRIYFYSGYTVFVSKGNSHYVRPVRSF